MFGWVLILLIQDEDEERGDGLQIVILKHIFTPELLQEDQEIEEIKREMREEIERIGPVKRINFYETHPEGIVEVKFISDKDA